MYGVIGLVFLGQSGGEGPQPVLVYALAGGAVMQSGLALLLPGMLQNMAPLQRNIIRWACAESVGVLGLVVRALGAGTETFLGFVGWSFLLLLILHPRPPTPPTGGAG